MKKNTSISLGNHFKNFIDDEISSGRYNSASEVVRSALRLLETEEQKIKNLKKALEAGEDSKMINDFDSRKHLQDLHNIHT